MSKIPLGAKQRASGPVPVSVKAAGKERKGKKSCAGAEEREKRGGGRP